MNPPHSKSKRSSLLFSSLPCVLLAAAFIIFLAALTIPNLGLGLGFSPPLELLLIQGQIAAASQSPATNLSAAAPPPGQKETPAPAPAPATDRSIDSDLSCDLYTGKWVLDSGGGPLYRHDSCPVLSQAQNCQGNGRPDNEYERWRWVPHGCELPRFNATEFFRLMRGKIVAFVGDSVARNQMESLLCILMQAETPVNRGSRRMQRWHFPSHSVTVVRIWSSWLVRFASGDTSVDNATKVHMDQVDDNFMSYLPKVDVLVLSCGHWFVKKTAFMRGGQLVGAQGWKPANPLGMITIREAFAESMTTALNALVSSPGFRGLTVLRTFSPDHYKGGSWNTGGSCTGITKPLTSEQVTHHTNPHASSMRQIQLEAFAEARRNARNGSRLVLMDVTPVFDYRADGHPSVFRDKNPSTRARAQAQDCLHWCMPGPVDTWNEFLLHILKHKLDH